MVIASHISNTPTTALVPKHFHRARWLFVFLPALISLVVPATAWGDIYKWTDEHGRINISNVPPPTSGKAKNIEIVLKEPKPTSIPDHAATSSEQALLARIDNLERQLRTQQYAPHRRRLRSRIITTADTTPDTTAASTPAIIRAITRLTTIPSRLRMSCTPRGLS